MYHLSRRSHQRPDVDPTIWSSQQKPDVIQFKLLAVAWHGWWT